MGSIDRAHAGEGGVVCRLAAQIIDFTEGRLTRRIAGKPLLAGFDDLLRAFVIKALGDPLAPASSAMESSPRSPSRMMQIFSSKDYRLRVWRRISRT